MTVTAVVLAGGRGSRIGGEKALVQLGGRPLISYPIAAARAAGLSVVVAAKRSTRLPPSLDAGVLVEPETPVHPLLGVITALEQYPAVIAIPCDMPFLAPAALAALAAARDEVATLWPGRPFPALYRRALIPRLRQVLEAGGPVRSTQPEAHAAPFTSAHSREQTVINTPADLVAAERLLSRP